MLSKQKETYFLFEVVKSSICSRHDDNVGHNYHILYYSNKNGLETVLHISYENLVTFICDRTRPQKCYQIKRRIFLLNIIHLTLGQS